MTREIRSRRAGLSRDESRQQPLYSRLLGLQYVTPNGFLCFMFFEGAVALGVLLALAELVSWWGVLALPVTVALMVKLNDVVAGAVMQTPTARPARPSAPRTAAAPVSTARHPVPTPADDLPFFADRASETRTMPAAVPAVRRAAVRPAVTPAGGYPAVRPATTVVRSTDPVAAIRAAGATPAAVRTGNVAAGRGPGSWTASPAPTAVPDAGPLNGPPTAGHWDAPTEQLDSPLRWARQAASRRYE